MCAKEFLLVQRFPLLAKLTEEWWKRAGRGCVLVGRGIGNARQENGAVGKMAKETVQAGGHPVYKLLSIIYRLFIYFWYIYYDYLFKLGI